MDEKKELAKLADLADSAGMTKAANAVDSVLAGRYPAASGKFVNVLAKISRDAAGNEELSKTAKGLEDWFRGVAEIGGEAEQLSRRIQDSGVVKYFLRFVSDMALKKKNKIQKSKIDPYLEPVSKGLRDYWMLAANAGLKLPPVPNLATARKFSFSIKELKAHAAAIGEYVEKWANTAVARQIDEASKIYNREELPPKEEAAPKPPPAAAPAPQPPKSAPPEPASDPNDPKFAPYTDPLAPYADVPKEEMTGGQWKVRENWRNPGTPYFHNKTHLAAPVIQAIRANIALLPVELRSRAMELENFFRQQGGFRAASMMDNVVTERKNNLVDLFQKFFGDQYVMAENFVAKVLESLSKTWSKEFLDVDAELLRMDKEGKSLPEMAKELSSMGAGDFEESVLKGLLDSAKAASAPPAAAPAAPPPATPAPVPPPAAKAAPAAPPPVAAPATEFKTENEAFKKIRRPHGPPIGTLA